MIFADDIPDDSRGLLVRFVPIVAQFAHCEEHARVHGFQAVADVGQGAADDDAHRVIQVGFAHLVFEIYGQYFASDLGHLRESGAAFTAFLSGFKGSETWSETWTNSSTYPRPTLSPRRGLADILRNARCSRRFEHRRPLDRANDL